MLKTELSEGFTDLVNEPSKGWEKDGATGSLSGLKDGVISATTHSVKGFVGMGIKTLEGTVSSVNNCITEKTDDASSDSKSSDVPPPPVSEQD